MSDQIVYTEEEQKIMDDEGGFIREAILKFYKMEKKYTKEFVKGFIESIEDAIDVTLNPALLEANDGVVAE